MRLGNINAILEHAPDHSLPKLFYGDVLPHAGSLVERQFGPEVDLRGCHADFDCQLWRTGAQWSFVPGLAAVRGQDAQVGIGLRGAARHQPGAVTAPFASRRCVSIMREPPVDQKIEACVVEADG